jgi:uncharacterized iron-regulated membrane protein
MPASSHEQACNIHARGALSAVSTAARNSFAARSQHSWRRSPQRVLLRRALFQVHLWTGVAIALYAVVIGLTGSALIFKAELDRAAHPAIYSIPRRQRTISFDRAVQQIEVARPQWTAFALSNFEGPDAAELLMRRSAGALSPDYRIVSFSPYTGRVLLDRLRYDGVLGFLSNLHVYLLSGETGLLVSGWMAVGLLILCLTGIVLWWPGVQRWASALVLRRRASWSRLNFDLHTVIGFWSCAALLIVTLTGLDFAFPGPSGKVIELFTGNGWRDSGVSLDAIATPPSTMNAPAITINQAIDAALRALPPDAPPGYLQFPSHPGAPFRITGYYTGAAPFSQLVRILIDSRTGALLASSDTRDQDFGSRLEQYFVALHFGLLGGSGWLGLLVKVTWVFLGIVPALLAVTGLLMYWNRKLRLVWKRLYR